MSYLELTEDQMVQKLAEIQKLVRTMLKVGRAQPYDEDQHAKACHAVIRKSLWLAAGGDVV